MGTTESAFDTVNQLHFEGITKRDRSIIKKVKKRRLYARYALESEYKEATEYQQDINTKYSEVAASSSCLDVEGVNWDTKESELVDVFNRVGSVVRVNLYPRKDLSAGSAFVEMMTTNDAVQAVLTL